MQRREPVGGEVDALAVPLAARGLLTRLCGDEPVTIIIDDLQWLDQATVGSLGFALRRMVVARERLSLLVASRPDPGAGADFIRVLPEPHYEFSLPPLADWAIGQVLRKRLGPRWTPPLSAGVAHASQGNPFLALMIAQAMQSDVSKWRWSAQQGHDPVFPVPPSLVGLLGEKVTLLPADARDVLLLNSAAGRLTVAQLRAIVDDEARLRRALDAAADWDVATVGAGSAVTFTHPMLASAVYDAAAPSERRRAHRVLAELLDDPVERARHRARSITTPDEAVATELEQAAETSRSRGAQALAGELLEAAALATPTGTEQPGGLDRWLRAVDTYIDAGDRMAAQAALDKGAALAAAPLQQAKVLIRRLKLTDHFAGVRSLADEALQLAPRDTEVRAEILQILAMVHRMQGRGDDALEISHLATAEAAAVHRPDVELVALNNQMASEWHWAKGYPEATLREIERLADAGELGVRSLWVVWAHGFFAAWNDPNAEKWVRDGIAAAVEDGRYGDLSYLYICLVLILIRTSRVRDAQAALAEADRSGAWASSTFQEDMARALVNAYAGDLVTARELAHGAAERARASGSTYWLAGFLAQIGFAETSARNWPAALAALREVAEIFARTKMVELEQLLWAVDYADAALQLGELDDVEQAISFLRRQGNPSRPEATIAAGRCAALLTAARGDSHSALSDFVRVVSQPAAECPFEAARSQLALGQLYRRTGSKSRANEALRAAATAFAELGTPRWAERARDEADRLGLQSTKSALTETERRVAELVATGQSNQEVAAELFMSVKTVEANLTRIYRKLSVRSRRELATLAIKPDAVTTSMTFRATQRETDPRQHEPT
jgi:DNA-binding NarL/FixJ family response regulator